MNDEMDYEKMDAFDRFGLIPRADEPNRQTIV